MIDPTPTDGPHPRWYSVNNMGMATLCADKADAEDVARTCDMEWPHHAPHVAMQLVDAAHLEAERTARQAAQLRIEDLQAHLVRADAERCKAVAAERERLCALIKAADDKASEGDYMLDSDDCISVIKGTWNHEHN